VTDGAKVMGACADLTSWLCLCANEVLNNEVFSLTASLVRLDDQAMPLDLYGASVHLALDMATGEMDKVMQGNVNLGHAAVTGAMALRHRTALAGLYDFIEEAFDTDPAHYELALLLSRDISTLALAMLVGQDMLAAEKVGALPAKKASRASRTAVEAIVNRGAVPPRVILDVASTLDRIIDGGAVPAGIDQYVGTALF
jgi:hypothetical protein